MSPIIVHCRTNSWQPTALQRICTRASQLNYLRKTLKLFLLERSQALLLFHLFDSLWMWNEHVTKPLCWSSQVAWTINWSSPFPYYPDFKQQQPVRYKLFPHFEILFLIILILSTILISIGGRDSGHSDPCCTFVSFQNKCILLFFFLPSRGWVMVENVQKVSQFCVELFQQMHIAHVIVSAPLRLHAALLPILPVAPDIMFSSFQFTGKLRKGPNNKCMHTLNMLPCTTRRTVSAVHYQQPPLPGPLVASQLHRIQDPGQTMHSEAQRIEREDNLLAPIGQFY